ncbi:hypothetical protein [Candidatus Tokpelaia sp.]|uniref:hypothetical protein n=1 Tax=Candidatus Tokpelaia sp. TaxID=2233777 RepID=UPI001238FAF7|nr:hypothetical protein [Candidatus Tokpelaia sp.]KAA6405347.1 hypothetical protein DPQ22_04585 [Candidatus Tokpelaia sp.]
MAQPFIDEARGRPSPLINEPESCLARAADYLPLWQTGHRQSETARQNAMPDHSLNDEMR